MSGPVNPGRGWTLRGKKWAAEPEGLQSTSWGKRKSQQRDIFKESHWQALSEQVKAKAGENPGSWLMAARATAEVVELVRSVRV